MSCIAWNQLRPICVQLASLATRHASANRARHALRRWKVLGERLRARSEARALAGLFDARRLSDEEDRGEARERDAQLPHECGQRKTLLTPSILASTRPVAKPNVLRILCFLNTKSTKCPNLNNFR